jgi:ABC transport system ATP-binding/permease protein
MSEEILEALAQLFAIISKQDSGTSAIERDFVISFYEKELAKEMVPKYVALYDKYALDEAKAQEASKEKQRATLVSESVRVLKLGKGISKTLTQKQKVVVLFKILELVASDQSFTKQKMEIISTIADVFKIPKPDYKLIESFVVEPHSSAPILDSEDILIFDDDKPTEGSKKKYIDSGELDGEIIFIRVKSVDLYFTRYTGNDDIFLNGILAKKNAIYLFSHGSIFKTPKGKPLYYSDLVNQFTEDTQLQKVSFNVNDLEFRFPNGAIGLRDVNLSENRGKLVGIMGSSGAGKTTMLNVLAGLTTPSKGKVLINGFNLHDKEEKKNLEGVIGYIAQDDLLIEELTVFQNLYYNAKLCFKHLSNEEIEKKVNEVLGSLGLDKIKDLIVGNVLNKKISGGQRKRLNIALELIREPALLFVDEPTSGLSSRDSENVIDLLKELSLKGKLIFVVIHQPSLDIYKMFDEMFILDTGGYPIYYGNPLEGITYFKRIVRQLGNEQGTPEQMFNIIEAQVVDEYGEYTNKRKITPTEWHKMYQENFKIHKVEDIKEKPAKTLNIPSKFFQMLIFAMRDALAKLNNTQYMVINLLEAPFLAFLMAIIIRYKNASNTEDYVFRYNDNIPAYILICIIIALFMGLTISAEEIIKDRKILKRESFLNLSRTSYLVSKLLILFSFSAIQTLSFVIIGNWVLDIEGMNLAYWLVLFSVSCFANLLGLNISSAFDSAVAVYVLIPLLLIPQMILSGGIFNFDKLNNAVVEKGKTPFVADIWASRWAYEALCVEQYKNNTYGKLFYDIEQMKSVANYKTSAWYDQMEKALNYAVTYSKEKSDSSKRLLAENLMLLQNEIQQESKHKYLSGAFEKLEAKKIFDSKHFNESVAEDIRKVLELSNSYYSLMQSRAMESNDSLYALQEANKNKGLDFNKLQNQYYNEYLAEFVKNLNIKDRSVIANNRIVQQIDPIFHIPNNISGALDYRSHFFAPVKHFMGNLYYTYNFNTAVIWVMTIFLYFTLYFDVLGKIVHAGSKIKINLGIMAAIKKLLAKMKKKKPVVEVKDDKKKKKVKDEEKIEKAERAEKPEKVEKIDAETTE